MFDATYEVPMKDLSEFIDGGAAPFGFDFPGRMPSSTGAKTNERLEDALMKLQEKGLDPLRNQYVIDIDSSNTHSSLGYSPCLTRTRAGNGGHWLSWKQRRMNLNEILRLQGVQPELVPRGIITDRQIAMVAGNAVPIPMLSRVIDALLVSSGLR